MVNMSQKQRDKHNHITLTWICEDNNRELAHKQPVSNEHSGDERW